MQRRKEDSIYSPIIILWYYDTLHVTEILYFFSLLFSLAWQGWKSKKENKKWKKKKFYEKEVYQEDQQMWYRSNISKNRLEIHAIYRGMVNWLCHWKGKGEGEISSFESEETVLPLKMASDDNVPCRVYAKKCSKTLIEPWILVKSNCTVIVEIFYTIVR